MVGSCKYVLLTTCLCTTALHSYALRGNAFEFRMSCLSGSSQHRYSTIARARKGKEGPVQLSFPARKLKAAEFS